MRSKIAAALNIKGGTVEEEVHCVAEAGSTRRVDIIAYSNNFKTGYTSI